MTTSNGCGIVVRLQSFKFKFKDTLRKCTKKNTQNTVLKEIGCLFTVIVWKKIPQKKKKKELRLCLHSFKITVVSNHTEILIDPHEFLQRFCQFFHYF